MREISLNKAVDFCNNVLILRLYNFVVGWFILAVLSVFLSYAILISGLNPDSRVYGGYFYTEMYTCILNRVKFHLGEL